MRSTDVIHRSRATEITIERLRVLNRKHTKGKGLFVEDLMDESGNPTGTKVSYDIYLRADAYRKALEKQVRK